MPGHMAEALGGKKEMGTSAGNTPEKDGQGRGETGDEAEEQGSEVMGKCTKAYRGGLSPMPG